MLSRIVLVFLVVAYGANAYPLHASCKLTWSFPNTNCSTVNTALVNQIKKWGPNTACGSTEKCLYTLKDSSSSALKLTHKTPVHKYVDDVSFAFDGSGASCTVHGYSTSETWYAVLDDGTNYCNMHNLLTGAGLDSNSGFAETTSNSDCTEYTSANCGKY
ncbi:uncharacterized protein [Oscarella lobularis]|uniref:uncharacterized protein n=1 Tax=Oscarella lobularis TaxID=121494 RepID=UPI003314313B